jgi:hypothetical protein
MVSKLKPVKQTEAQLRAGREAAAESGCWEAEIVGGNRCWLHPCLMEHPRWEQVKELVGFVRWVGKQAH